MQKKAKGIFCGPCLLEIIHLWFIFFIKMLPDCLFPYLSGGGAGVPAGGGGGGGLVEERAVVQTLPSPYSKITAPRKPHRCSSGHASDNRYWPRFITEKHFAMIIVGNTVFLFSLVLFYICSPITALYLLVTHSRCVLTTADE